MPLLVLVLALVLSILRIETMPVHVEVPRPPHQQRGHFDYEGLIHWHTRYSGDALGTYEEAAVLGNQYHLDFLVTTEHNNLNALADHKEGWHGQMLTLVGVESSRAEGYLLGLNMTRYTTHDDPTEAFLREAASQDGLVLIAHSQNPRWRWRGPIDARMSGQEILDLTDQFNTASVFSLLTGVFYYPWNRHAAYLQVYHRPNQTLAMWDKITGQRPFVGIFAPDIHQAIRIWRGSLMRFPKADEMVPFAHDHIILPVAFTGNFAQDKPMLYGAIQSGRLYVAIDLLQDATGFFFSARQKGRIAWMGGRLPAGETTDFLVTLPEHVGLRDLVINVYHNGEKFASGHAAGDFMFQASAPGAYRVEVEVEGPNFWGLNKRMVWIYSNPIYLR